MKTTSWVIRTKATGAVLFETFDPKKVAALNTDKYEAVPIAEYLASLNERLYHLEAVNGVTGARHRLTASPDTHRACEIILSKQSAPSKNVRIEFVEAK